MVEFKPSTTTEESFDFIKTPAAVQSPPPADCGVRTTNVSDAPGFFFVEIHLLFRDGDGSFGIPIELIWSGIEGSGF
jgi:hypothetical protein